jgi:biotin operon repressor
MYPVILLLSYPLAMFVRTLLSLLNINLYSGYFAQNFSLFDPGILMFYFDGTWAAVLGCILAGLFGTLFSLRLGIATAFAVSLTTGISNGNTDYTTVNIVFGLALGFIIGPLFNNIRAIKKDGLANVTLGNLTAVLVGLIVGTVVGMIGGYWSGVAAVLIGGKALQDTDNIIGSASGLAVGGIASSLIFFLLGKAVRALVHSKEETIELSIRIGTAIAGSIGISVGVNLGDLGLLLGSAGFVSNIPSGIIQGILTGGAFLPLYLLSYYRLPLYPFDAFSMIQTYYGALGNPEQALTYLRRSALHFDECVFLPLPFLTDTLRIAKAQNQSATLNEIEFIVSDRPQQSHAAQIVAYEIALEDLFQRRILADISQAYLALPRLLSPRVRHLNVPIARLFSHLEDVSRNAASYAHHNSIGRDKRDSYDALQRILVDLNQINPQAVFPQAELGRKLQEVVELWQALARQAQETLNINVNHYSLISNPYTAGPTLLPVDGMPNPVFVGRDDIVTRLNRALQKTPHPTFCLTGERRMGKSSILRQLPVLLGAEYIPIFCDLQNPAALSSIAAFFTNIGEMIEEHLVTRHFQLENLDRQRMEELQKENEAAVYTEFDHWLKSVERVLEANKRVLLLMFDEFENLETFRQKGLLDLDLLLSWLRSVSQSSSQITLLFCGLKTIYDMGPDWTRHFVNVERIKVSFLRPSDARDLINRPVAAHSTHTIFDEEVAEEIMRVTHCHPFLLQALCSKLIDNLNDASQEQAHPQEIALSIEEIFENRKDYFWNQWQRSSEGQQQCLLALHTLGKASGAQIAQQCKLSKQSVFEALDQLRERDIVIKEQQMYQFAVPIFAQWIDEQYHLIQ